MAWTTSNATGGDESAQKSHSIPDHCLFQSRASINSQFYSRSNDYTPKCSQGRPEHCSAHNNHRARLSFVGSHRPISVYTSVGLWVYGWELRTSLSQANPKIMAIEINFPLNSDGSTMMMKKKEPQRNLHNYYNSYFYIKVCLGSFHGHPLLCSCATQKVRFYYQKVGCGLFEEES